VFLLVSSETFEMTHCLIIALFYNSTPVYFSCLNGSVISFSFSVLIGFFVILCHIVNFKVGTKQHFFSIMYLYTLLVIWQVLSVKTVFTYNPQVTL